MAALTVALMAKVEDIAGGECMAYALMALAWLGTEKMLGVFVLDTRYTPERPTR